MIGISIHSRNTLVCAWRHEIAALHHFTAMVTPDCDATPPTLTVTGTADPGETDGGTTALTCKTPATSPGAEPAYWTVASIPPILTVSGNKGDLVFDGVTLPVTPEGEVCPSPVA
jgi:hypothetical protein